MAPAFYVAAGLAAVVGFLAFTRSSASGAAGGSGASGGAGAGSATGKLPPDLQAKFDELMAKGEDPDAMDQVADRLEQQGFKTDALKLRLRASQLRAAHPVPSPAPAPSPAAPKPAAPAPAPAGRPITPGLAVLMYVPDVAPVGSAAAGNYFPRSVTEDAKALRFLGLNAGNPGGGVSQQSDLQSKSGAWNPTFQAAVKAFQASPFGKSKGLTADGWIGPNTRTALLAAVETKNAEVRAKNAASGQSDVEFAGARDPMSRIVTAGALPGSRRVHPGAPRGPHHGRA